MPKLIHYTEGGPWHGYTRQDYVKEWVDELDSMLIGQNPCAGGILDITPLKVDFEVIYEAK